MGQCGERPFMSGLREIRGEVGERLDPITGPKQAAHDRACLLPFGGCFVRRVV